jgi:hypothetical protein
VDTETRDHFYSAIDLYNRGKYLQAQHELDELYPNAGEMQPIVRAVAMLAAAMHLHFQRGGGRGVTNLLQQCLIVLEDSREPLLGIETGELYEAVEAYVLELRERRKPGASFFDRWLAPRVRYRVS